jgi:type VI secretion system protein VasD
MGFSELPRRNFLLLLLGGAGLSACSPQQALQGAQKMGQVAMNPDVAVGLLPKDTASKATVSIYGEKDINPNPFNQPQPVDVWLFQLSDDSRLKTLDYITLTSDPKGSLAEAYVEHKQTQIEPGKSKVIEDWEFKKDTVAFGVAVGFREIDKVNWRAQVDVKPKGETYQIVVAIRGKDVFIDVHR